MKQIWIALLITVLLLSLFPDDVTAQTDGLSVRFQIRYLEFDETWNSYKMLVNISANGPGHVVYLEEYYTVDSNNNPKYSSSSRYDGGDLMETESSYNTTFEILRPVPHGGKFYTLIKAVVLMDNKRVLEHWLTQNKDFLDNTGTVDDSSAGIQNVEKYETRYGSASPGSYAVVEYTSLDVISQINITGHGEVNLRVELLKSRPDNAARPAGYVYRYFDISAENELTGIAPRYRIENIWMTNRSISERKIWLFNWNTTEKKWVQLNTTVLDRDSQYTYFESVSPELGTFAIIGFTVKNTTTSKVNSTVTPTGQKKVINTTEQGTENEKQPVNSLPGFGFVLTVAAFLLIFRYFKKVI